MSRDSSTQAGLAFVKMRERTYSEIKAALPRTRRRYLTTLLLVLGKAALISEYVLSLILTKASPA
jgi:hypothetical protein